MQKAEGSGFMFSLPTIMGDTIAADIGGDIRHDESRKASDFLGGACASEAIARLVLSGGCGIVQQMQACTLGREWTPRNVT